MYVKVINYVVGSPKLLNSEPQRPENCCCSSLCVRVFVEVAPLVTVFL